MNLAAGFHEAFRRTGLEFNQKWNHKYRIIDMELDRWTTLELAKHIVMQKDLTQGTGQLVGADGESPLFR